MGHGSSPADLLGPLNEVERKHAPATLFHAGDIALLKQRRVAVVGSRSTSDDGLRRAARLARELVAADVVVVSGLAEGIDTSAHRAAIAAGGRTIAVLGNPLSTFYPRQNRELQEIIAREHLLLSQFADGVPPRKDNFPMRNRTMALVSQATVIVDAQERSGTVSQGWEAIRLGRPLYLLRSLAENPSLEWPGLMLQYGAEILDDVAALVSELPPRAEPELAEVAF